MGRQNLVFVCHNVFPHERFPLDRILTGLALNDGSYFIVYEAEEWKELAKIQPQQDYAVTPHPTYNAFRFEGMNGEKARKKLLIGRNERILLFLGYVREYRRLKYLLRAMPATSSAEEKGRFEL